jgi:hypothetical protein
VAIFLQALLGVDEIHLGLRQAISAYRYRADKKKVLST